MTNRECVDVGLRVAPVVGAGDVDIVHVEQQAAPGALYDFAQEVDLVVAAFLKNDIGRRILQKNAPAEMALRLIDVSTHKGERFRCVGQRKEVVKERRIVGRPS